MKKVNMSITEPQKLGLHSDLAKYYDLLFEEKYSKEAEFIDRVFRTISESKVNRVLDLMCGTGSHILELTNKGYEVVGIDVSTEMLDVARNKLEKFDTTILNHDARELPFQKEFDAVYCWFNSFQYLYSDEDIFKTLKGVHKSLKNNGLFIIDLRNGVKSMQRLIGRLPQKRTVEKGGVRIDRTFTKVTFEGSIMSVWINHKIDDNGKILNIEEQHRHRLLEYDEFLDFLTKNSFEVKAVLGSLDDIDSPYDPDGDKMVFVAMKK